MGSDQSGSTIYTQMTVMPQSVLSRRMPAAPPPRLAGKLPSTSTSSSSNSSSHSSQGAAAAVAAAASPAAAAQPFVSAESPVRFPSVNKTTTSAVRPSPMMGLPGRALRRRRSKLQAAVQARPNTACGCTDQPCSACARACLVSSVSGDSDADDSELVDAVDPVTASAQVGAASRIVQAQANGPSSASASSTTTPSTTMLRAVGGARAAGRGQGVASPLPASNSEEKDEEDQQELGEDPAREAEKVQDEQDGEAAGGDARHVQRQIMSASSDCIRSGPRMEWHRDSSSQFAALYPVTVEDLEPLPTCSANTLDALFPVTRCGGFPLVPHFSAFNPDVPVVLDHIAAHVCHWISQWGRSRSAAADPHMGVPSDDHSFDLAHFSNDPAVIEPTPGSISHVLGWLFRVLQIETQCCVVTAVYLQRLISRGVRLTRRNFEPILVAAVMVSTKVWDDLSTINDDFTQALPHYALSDLNRLERVFLGRLSWDCHVTRSEYTKFYFGLADPEPFATYRDVEECPCPLHTQAVPGGGHSASFSPSRGARDEGWMEAVATDDSHHHVPAAGVAMSPLPAAHNNRSSSAGGAEVNE